MITVGAEVLQSWSTSNVDSLCIDPLNGQANNKSAISSKLTPLIALICSPMKFHLAIQQLQQLSLIHYKSNVDTFVLRIHGLVQIMIQDSSRKEDTHLHWFHIAVALMCGAFQCIEDPTSICSWAQCETFTAHIQSLLEWDEQHAIRNYELIRARKGIVMYLQSRWRKEAEVLHRQVLTDMVKLLGPEHDETLDVMHCLDMVCQNTKAESSHNWVPEDKEKESIIPIARPQPVCHLVG